MKGSSVEASVNKIFISCTGYTSNTKDKIFTDKRHPLKDSRDIKIKSVEVSKEIYCYGLRNGVMNDPYDFKNLIILNRNLR